MPYTINGVGTSYYGKRCRFQRRGTCEHCNATTDLQSYDTTLYGVVLFVPLLPLYSYRVLDLCSSCSQHRAIRLKEWNRLKDEFVTTRTAAIEAAPDDPAPMIDAIDTAAGFQDLPQFEAFCTYAAEAFPEHPDVLTSVANGQMYFSQWDRAVESLEKILAIRPADVVRRQVALAYLKQLRPDDAAPHLQHIIDKKQTSECGFLSLLADGYSAVGNHAAAAETLHSLAELEPAVLSDKNYKKKLAKSEKLASQGSTKAVASALLGSPAGESYQEGSRFQLSRWIGPAMALGLAILYLWSAISTGQARKVWIVSGLPVPYTAKINGQDLLLQPFSHVRHAVPEGDISVSVEDAKLGIPAGTAVIRTNFFLRPFFSPTYVINPDQTALVIWEKAFYGVPGNVPNGEEKISGNQLLHEYSSVDFEFKPLPGQVESDSKTTSRTRVGTLAPPEVSLQLMPLIASSNLPPESASEVVWRWVNVQPDNEILLTFATATGDRKLITERFKSRLSDRPVLVDWHRAYQSLREKDPTLLPEYELMLAKEPDNADLIYLVARIVEDPVREKELFEKAAHSNPPSAYAWNALAISSLARGEFESALEQVSRARELLPDRRAFGLAYEGACMALGKWKQLALTYEQDRLRLPQISPTILSPKEVQFQIWDGNPDGAETLRRQMLEAAMSGGVTGLALQQREQALDFALLEARGQWDAIARQASKPDAAPTFEELLLLKKWDEAADSIEQRTGNGDGPLHILLSLLAGEAGNGALADAERELGVKALEDSNTNFSPFSAALKTETKTIDPARLIAAAIPPADKCVLLVAVARRFPDQAADLLVLARKLNFQRDLQAHLMEPLLGAP